MAKFALKIDEMENLPKDPNILLSYINTKLRDNYPDLDNLCDDLDVNRAELEAALASGGFTYNPDTNRFA